MQSRLLMQNEEMNCSRRICCGEEAGRPVTAAPFLCRSADGRQAKAAVMAVSAVVIAGLVSLGGWRVVEQGRTTAEQFAKHGLWQEVHAPLARYLWIHPGDAQANLLAAEALVKDDSLPLVRRVTDSLVCLARIPESAPEAVEARIAEARVKLFLRYEPMAAARALERAIQLDPTAVEPQLLLWKLFELTGRGEDAEERFWACYRLSSAEEQPMRLRDWYLSQFFPLTSTSELDRLMGFRGAATESGVSVEMRRLQRFRLAEPQEAVPHAALAELFLRENEPELALEVLDEAAGELTLERQKDPFILGVVVETLLELGEAEPAIETFGRWPQPADGRRYWLVRARVLQEAENDPMGAAEAYRKGLVSWPGSIDWRTLNRLAGCLARAGDAEQAALEREHVRRIQEQIPQERLQALLDALASPGDPKVAAVMAAFYRDIERPQEAAAWQQVVQTAPAANPPRPAGL